MTRNFLLVLLTLSTLSAAIAQPLRVSENKRYLQLKGRPFLWLGDTAWELFHRLNREEATKYLNKRARQGFTVIQTVILAESDGLRSPNSYGEVPFIDLDPAKPNEAYFEHVDFIINKAAELGLYVALLPTWGDKVFSDRPGAGPVVFNKENAKVYGTFLGKRYGNKPVIWVLGGDRNIANNEVMETWKAMAYGLKEGDKGRNLITYHPAGEASSSKWFQQADWIDFNMYQTGHAHRFMPVYDFAQKDFAQTPVKPAIEAEPAYEDIPVEFWTYLDWKGSQTVPDSILNSDRLLTDKSFFKKGFFNDYDVRVHAYWNFLSGAGGYTYGHNSVWQMFKKGGSFVIPCLYDWEEALERPGAEDIRHLKRFFEKKSFSQLVPDQSLIVSSNPTDSTHIRTALSADRSFAVAYIPSGKAFHLDTRKVKSSQVSAWWFNPRNGESGKARKLPVSAGQVFTPPGKGPYNDWVLVLDAL